MTTAKGPRPAELALLSELLDVASQVQAARASASRAELEQACQSASVQLRQAIDASLVGEVVTKRNAARFLGVSEDTVARWLAKQVLAPAQRKSSPKTFLSPHSVLNTKRALDALRAQGVERRFFARLISAAPGTQSGPA